MRVRDRRGHEDREQADRLEEEAEGVHAGGGERTGTRAAAMQYDVDQVDGDPQHCGDSPPRETPTREQEHRQRHEHDDRRAERRKQVAGLWARRRKD